MDKSLLKIAIITAGLLSLLLLYGDMRINNFTQPLNYKTVVAIAIFDWAAMVNNLALGVLSLLLTAGLFMYLKSPLEDFIILFSVVMLLTSFVKFMARIML